MLSDEGRERLEAEIRADVEALADEDVLAFGFFGQAGLYGGGSTFAMREGHGGGPLKPVLRSFFGRARGGGLPLQVLLALTPTRILAVAYETGGRGVSPTKVFRSWDRSVTTVAVEEGDRGLPTHLPVEARRGRARAPRLRRRPAHRRERRGARAPARLIRSETGSQAARPSRRQTRPCVAIGFVSERTRRARTAK